MCIFRKETQFSQGNNAVDAHSSHSERFLQQAHIFLNLAESAFLDHSYVHLENYDWLKYSFKKLTQFSHGNKC
jgi:hypothetical protein